MPARFRYEFKIETHLSFGFATSPYAGRIALRLFCYKFKCEALRSETFVRSPQAKVKVLWMLLIFSKSKRIVR